MDMILAIVADYFCLSKQDLVRHDRREPLATQRHIAMFLIRDMLGAPYSKIGSLLDRDHTTIVYGVKTIRRKLTTDAEIAYDVEALKQDILANNRRTQP